jgi:hypothetical protein
VRTCSKCGESKPLSEFWRDKRKRDGYMVRCKRCKTADIRAWFKAHPENHKERYWANRDLERERHLVRKYGVTFARYAELLKEQHGCCAICGRPEPPTRMLDVDHDHKTGQVRGLLCTSCNRVIGHTGDSPTILRSAADYLERTSIVPQVGAEVIRAYMEASA